MRRWEVKLQGDANDLAELAKATNLSVCTIRQVKQEYYLTSELFDNLAKDYKVREKAEYVVNILNGVKMAFGAFPKISVGEVAEIDEIGRRIHHGYRDAGAMVNMRDNITSGVLKRWLDIASNDINVETALWLYGSLEHNWRNLYLVFEIIRKDMGGKKGITNKGWTSGRMLDAFAGTANSFKLLGPEARHGVDAGPPPTNTIALHEAQALVKQLLENWINSKAP